jgi:squalene synthase HpnC
MAVDQHYENFPVASIFLPPAIRAHAIAIYRFARHADDVADEGEATTETRALQLTHLSEDIVALFSRNLTSKVRAPTVQGLSTLHNAQIVGIEAQPFLDLLSAFSQDLLTARYQTYSGLADYCRRSANPVGRLMLALVGVRDAASLAASDHICTALQLINFWQDAAIDASRGRIYAPLEDFARFNVSTDHFPNHPQHQALMKFQCDRAAALMFAGVPLVAKLRGRFRLEIAFTIAGGLRILEKIAANGYDVRIRPTVRWYDAPRLLLLAIRVWLHSTKKLP